nr:hypothetical protein CFP56_08302 [Quercus suber]
MRFGLWKENTWRKTICGGMTWRIRRTTKKIILIFKETESETKEKKQVVEIRRAGSSGFAHFQRQSSESLFIAVSLCV